MSSHQVFEYFRELWIYEIYNIEWKYDVTQLVSN